MFTPLLSPVTVGDDPLHEVHDLWDVFADASEDVRGQDLEDRDHRYEFMNQDSEKVKTGQDLEDRDHRSWCSLTHTNPLIFIFIICF